MKFKYRFSTAKIKCKEDISTGFLISNNKVITAVHSVKEYLSNDENAIEIIFRDKNGNKIIRNGIPIQPVTEDIDDFEIIALQLNETISHINSLECIKHDFEDETDVFTYGYPAVRQNEGTLINMKVLGDNGDIDLKVDSDSIKDYQGCSGGPLIYKKFVVGVMLEQVAENGEASRIGAVSFKKYEQYFKEIGLSLFEKANDIYRFDEYLMGCTNPKISLNFFNYQEEKFEQTFLTMLNEQSTIYLQGKTKEEVMGYALYIIMTKARRLIPKVLIIDGLEKWNELKNTCEDKILIPNFNANEITIIPKNVNIILYGEEDFLGNKQILKLNKRTLDNMRDKLNDEIDNLTLANQFVKQCNGLYSIFKRKIFEGKYGKPKWEEFADPVLLPTLLAGSWKENTKDILFIEQLSSKNYSEYTESIKNVTNGEDPFILHYNTGYESVFKIANVEESWEILSSKITKNQLSQFKDLTLNVFGETPSRYNLPIEEHYRSSLVTKEELEYSSYLKKGIIRSLIALALKKTTNDVDHQKFVDEIIEQIFRQIAKSSQWFAIAEFLPLMSEASPMVFIDTIEKEVSNPESKMWDLFKNTGDGLFGRNYYTHVLWSLEKLMCLEHIVPRVISVLVKLSERKLNYKIENSPISTLTHALCGWLHEINTSLDEKIELVDYVVENSSIGWEVLERILPDISGYGALSSMSRLDYRPYEFEFKLEYEDQVFKTYKAYTSIAINNAGSNFRNWEILFEKCSFIELGLYDLVRENLIQALSINESDDDRYILKEKIRDIIYRHRFYKNSDWALTEINIQEMEELFKLITFKCNIYNYLYLFINYELIELNPSPYNENERGNWKEEQQRLREERIKALRLIMENPNNSIWDLVSLLKTHDKTEHSQQIIGDILANDIDNYNLDLGFLNEVLENEAYTLFIYYVKAYYSKHGINIIENTLDLLNENHKMIMPILNIARVDEKVLAIVESYAGSIKDDYWTHFRINWDKIDRQVKEKVWTKLLEYKNFDALLNMIDIYFKNHLEKSLTLLEEILLNNNQFFINSQNSYLIINVFKNIYKETSPDMEKSFYLRICKLEWAYFNLLVGKLAPKYLKEELKTDPVLLSSLIRATYKSSKEEKDIDEMQKKLGEQAWTILYKLKFCPCVDQDKNVSIKQLEAWVKAFLEEIDKSGHEKVGRQILGECFSYSPITDDNVFPLPEICKVFEKYYTEDIGKGFLLGVMNSRGVFMGTQGKEEELLATKYAEYAKKIRIRFPKVSSELLKISDSYKNEALQEREQASFEI
ncbi:trypsin-like serine protease [Priestia megaterium]